MFGCDLKYGGESGIRTHVTLSSKHAFQACAFSHSAISPATNLLPKNLPQVASSGKRLRASLNHRPRAPRSQCSLILWPEPMKPQGSDVGTDCHSEEAEPSQSERSPRRIYVFASTRSAQ